MLVHGILGVGGIPDGEEVVGDFGFRHRSFPGFSICCPTPRPTHPRTSSGSNTSASAPTFGSRRLFGGIPLLGVSKYGTIYVLADLEEEGLI